MTEDELQELIARAIRAGRYSGKLHPKALPREDHNPVDLKDGERILRVLKDAGYIVVPNLDPSPWWCPCCNDRDSYQLDSSYEFTPRKGYVQEQERYT